MSGEGTNREAVAVGLVDVCPRELRFVFMPNLGLGYVAAALEADGFGVRVVDVAADGPDAWTRFLAEAPPIVGLNASSFYWDKTREAARRIKAAHPETRVVVGGPHVSVAEGEVLQDPAIDYAIIGEGEPILPLLTRLVLEGRERREDLEQVPGLIHRLDDGEVHVHPEGTRIADLGELPRPAFHLFRMDRYQAYPIITSRGCPYQCVFCSVPAINGRAWRYRQADDLADEIAWALDAYTELDFGRFFVIVDDTFNLKLRRVHEFCEHIEQRDLGVEWGVWGFRADRAPRELCDRMARAGCRSVAIGIESGDEDMLARIKKGETLADIEEGITNISGAGIELIGMFMIGNPGETAESAERSIEFARRMPLDRVDFYLARPYPKTELWDYVAATGDIHHPDYTQFHHFSNVPVFDTPEFPASERVRIYKKAKRLVRRRNTLTAVKRKIRRLTGTRPRGSARTPA